MCGRTACTLAPDDVCRACGYKSKDGKWRQPRWQEPPGGQKYYTSYNVAPGSHTPVLVSKQHFESVKKAPELETENFEELTDSVQESEILCEWVVQPMQWGLVPFWHTGDAKSVGFSMINARSDGILTKRSFKVPLEKGRRCVILVDGYFEWQQTPDGKKQPHFIYAPHATPLSVDKLNTNIEHGQETVYTGRRLLTLAGIFDICKPDDDGTPLYSYSIITVDAHKKIEWMHSRMPAVLEGEADVQAWLDYGSVPLSKAVELIRPRSSLHHHPVSTEVNSVKNKTEECVKLIDPEQERKKTEGGSSSLMKAWLSKGKKRTAEEGVQGDDKETAHDNQEQREDKTSVQDHQQEQGKDRATAQENQEQGEDKAPAHDSQSEQGEDKGSAQHDGVLSPAKKPKTDDNL